MDEQEIAELNQLLMPRMVEEYMVHVPHPIQQVALCVTSREVLFGGALGGGKSDFALMSALQFVDVPGYSCLVLKRTWPDLNSADSILDRFTKWMVGKNVKKKDGGRAWHFPSGARIEFGYINSPRVMTKFQGAEFQRIIFDEATLFEPEIYEYMRTRCRKPALPCAICEKPLSRFLRSDKVEYRHSQGSACNTPLPNPISLRNYGPASDGTTVFDIPIQMISTANPGNIGHIFFRDRFLTPETRIKDGVFIPSTIKDNAYIEKEEYMKNLEDLTPVQRERLINGDWMISDEGALFQRGDFEFVDFPPSESEVRQKVRFWDLAASDGQRADYTVGALVSRTHDNRWFLEDLIRVRELPPSVERLMRQTAEKDGIDVKIVAEMEPGSSGKSLISHLTRNVLAGYQFKGERPTGPKTARAGAVVSQVAAHNFFVVKNNKWNKDMLDEFTLFPNGQHDDQVDAVSGAMNEIAHKKKPVRLIV